MSRYLFIYFVIHLLYINAVCSYPSCCVRLSDPLTYCRPCSDPDSLCDSFVGDVTARLPVQCRSGVARRTDTGLVSVDRVLDSSTGLQHRCWLGGRKGIRPVKSEWWGAGVVVCLQRSADTGFHCHSLSLASVKSRLVFPFWYRLTRQRAVKRVFVIAQVLAR